MITALRVLTITLALGTGFLAKDGLVIWGNGKQVWSRDAEKVYVSACSVVEREFRINRVRSSDETHVFELILR